MRSTRLPGKILQPIAGVPMLFRVVARLRAARTLDAVVVALPDGPSDDPLASTCEAAGIAVHRGSETDVLDRYLSTARATGAGTIVRVTSDCPVIDPALVDEVVARRRETGADYASNIVTRSFPRGLDAEALSTGALERAATEGTAPHHREHVTAYVLESPGQFHIEAVTAPPDLHRPDVRWTVDTEEDLAALRRLYEAVPAGERDTIGAAALLALYDRDPGIAALNRHVRQKATTETA